MKRGMVGFVIAGVTMLAVPAVPVEAQDTSGLPGVWELERETPMGITTVLVTFVDEGDSTVAMMGRGDEAIPVGRVEYEDGVVSFPFDMRAVMAGMREGRSGPPAGAGAGARAGERVGGQAGRAGGPPHGVGAQGMRRPGAQRPDGAGSPVFRGTLEGSLIRGHVVRPRDGAGQGPEMVLRRAGGA